MNIVLKRVWNESIEHPHPSFPHMLIVVAAQHLLYEIIEVAIMAEHDVSAMIPDEAVLVSVARCQTANMVVALVDLPIFVPKLGEPICRTKPSGSCAYYENLAQTGPPSFFFDVQQRGSVNAELKSSTNALDESRKVINFLGTLPQSAFSNKPSAH